MQATNHSGRVPAGLVRWSKIAFDLVFPRNCPLCNRTLNEHDEGCICPTCLAAFKRIEPPMCRWCGRPVQGAISDEFVCSQCAGKKLHFDRALSAVLADARMLDVIHRFKYQRELYFGQHMAQLLVECAAKHVDWTRIDGILPVPLHPRKQRHREFNQAHVLTEALGRRFATPAIDGNLRRVVDTPSQTFLGAEERQKNLRDAFRARRPEEFEGKTLVLVDDVYTTGATSNACARELKKAGAVKVLVLTLARAT
ncbi:MAG: ComF family protein [Verrucomicrobiae bacterium]|nr:ComF family protein [Verrucomicrobiae bacterium]